MLTSDVASSPISAQATFEPLIAVIAEGQIANLMLTPRLKLFTTHYPMALAARNENLLLRPLTRGDMLEWPKHANGHVNSVSTKNTLETILHRSRMPNPTLVDEATRIFNEATRRCLGSTVRSITSRQDRWVAFMIL